MQTVSVNQPFKCPAVSPFFLFLQEGKEAAAGEGGDSDGSEGSDDSDDDSEEDSDEDSDEDEEEDNMEDEDGEENEEPLSLEWPDTRRKQATYLFLLPIVFPLWLTVPDVRNPVNPNKALN